MMTDLKKLREMVAKEAIGYCKTLTPNNKEKILTCALNRIDGLKVIEGIPEGVLRNWSQMEDVIAEGKYEVFMEFSDNIYDF